MRVGRFLGGLPLEVVLIFILFNFAAGTAVILRETALELSESGCIMGS